MVSLRDKAKGVLFLAAVGFVLWYAALRLTGYNSIFTHPAEDQYTLQAEAWLHGRLDLIEASKNLEIATFEGKSYNSFPPTPALIELVEVLIWGHETPIPFMLFLSGLLAASTSFLMISKGFASWWAPAWIALTLIFSGNALYPMAQGGVWYQAQIYGATFLLLGLYLVYANATPRWGLAFSCLALAVGCRPFHLVYAPLFAYLAVTTSGRRPKEVVIAFLKWGGPVLLVIFWHNFARFHHPFEFGHKYLPLMQSQKSLFGLGFFFRNLWLVFLSLPEMDLSYPTIVKFHPMGNAFWINNALVALALAGLGWMRGRLLQIFVLTTCLVWLPLLLHQSNGWVQFGYRYIIDLFPLVVAMIAMQPKTRELKARWIVLVFFISAPINLFGTYWVQRVISREEILQSYEDLFCTNCIKFD